MNPQKKTYRIRVNNQIRVPQVKVVSDTGEFIGVMATSDALRKAMDLSLDLVEVNPNSNPPVCKIIDYGKYKYDEKKKAAANKSAQPELKEIKLGPNTDDNDIMHKIKQAKEFLSEKDMIKFSIKFRGREITHQDLGKQKLQFIVEQLSDMIAAKPMIVTEGKVMSMVVFPKKG